MSKINKLCFSGIFLAYFSFISFSFATENHLTFSSSNAIPIDIYVKNSFIKITYNKKKIPIDLMSKRIFSQMDSMAVVSNKTFPMDSEQYFWAFIRKPSRNLNGTGFCGAGFEDYFYLFKVTKNKLKLIDEYQAQSCLDSFSIDIDEIKEVNEPNKKISFYPETGVIEFTQEFIKNETAFSREIKLTPSISKIVVETGGENTQK
jgi:hypothetical protein